MPINDSPLRYPGGKTQLTPYVIELLRANDLLGGVYAEPFAGGAGVGWKLLFGGYVSEVWINDIDPSIHAFWYSVLHYTEDLCERIAKTEITIDEWKRQKAVQKTVKIETLALGFSTLFLNRTNRSGILKAGVIGGLSQGGEWKMNCRFNREVLIAKVRRIAMYAEQIQLTRLDAREYLGVTCKKLPKVSLLNIDPPYYTKGPGLYCSFYRHDDHVALSTAIRKLKQPWMLTYDDTPEIRKLYSDLPTAPHLLTYYAQVKRAGVELLITPPALRTPTTNSRRSV